MAALKLQMTAAQHSSSAVPVASDAARTPWRMALRMKAAMVAVRKQRRKTMRVLTQGELMRATRTELNVLLRRIASELPNLPEGSAELRAAHSNLQNIRRALARPDFRPG
jgi:transketolase